MTHANAPNPATLETPSGKGSGDENFPVGSWLIRPALRPHIHAFYAFARAGDDIADNPLLDPQEKIVRLERMAAIIRGEIEDQGMQGATAMRASLVETKLDPVHALDLLVAFKRDATKLRYADWGDLLDYCRYSAASVGRHVLALHGSFEETWPASDLLCSALQIVNHLQDCGIDYARLDRVYLPLADLAVCGARVEDLSAAHAPLGLRRCLTLLSERMQPMLEKSRALPFQVKDRRLALEIAAIQALAERLTNRLLTEDPLADSVRLGKVSAFLTATGGIVRWWFARKRKPHG